MASAIEESNDIYIRENCGKYLVSPGKKEKAVTKEKTEKEKVESLKKAASPAVKVRPGKQVSARQTKAEKSRKLKGKIFYPQTLAFKSNSVFTLLFSNPDCWKISRFKQAIDW